MNENMILKNNLKESANKKRTLFQFNNIKMRQMKKEFIIASKISALKRKNDFKHALEIILEEFDGWWD